MQSRAHRAIVFGLLVACGTGAAWHSVPTLGNTKEQETTALITELKAQIEAIQRGMARKESERNELQERLKDAEKDLGALDQSIARVRAAIADELPRLAELDSQRVELQQKVGAEQATMNQEMKNLWALQQGGGLRILFSDQTPDQLVRNLAYYKRLLASRQDSITRYATLIEQVAANTEATRTSQQRLANQREQLERQRDQIEQLQGERRQTLVAINTALGTDAKRKAKLEADSQQLQTLLEALRQTLAELDTPSSYTPFSTVKGQLPSPVRGKASNRFGARTNVADMRWRGWLMPAAEGAEIKAIHHGRVVYADWLRGQGLLLIIDHGEGYLSLYGHNRSLQREVGDWVKPGDIIATVGASGGATSPGLYFEIRHDGQPVNPSHWIKR